MSIKFVATSKKKGNEKIQEFLHLLEPEPFDEDAESSLDERAEVALALLPLLLPQRAKKTNYKDFVRFISDENIDEAASKQESPFPAIIVKGTLKTPDSAYIVADKQALFKYEGGMLEGTLALLATYYVFMYKYPPALSNVILYLPKCVLQIGDDRKLPSSVIAFVNRLHSDGISHATETTAVSETDSTA